MNIVGVKLHKSNKIYFFDPGLIQISKGDKVIVQGELGEEYGEVAIAKRIIDDEKTKLKFKRIIRIANSYDIKEYENKVKKEKEALEVCKEKIKEHKLEMNVLDVDFKNDNSKVIFYFTADGRVDFRELVRDLAAIYRNRIELRQIGVRDEVKRLNGCGICGRELCCCSFLPDFETVSIKMAKEQNISLNPSKISGNCGRLMCCLKYEENVYQEKLERLPGIGAIVRTENGEGIVDSVEVLKERVRVRFKDGEGYYHKQYDAKDIKILKDVSLEEKLAKEEKEIKTRTLEELDDE